MKFPISPEDLVGQSVYSYFDGENRMKMEEHLRKASGGEHQHFEVSTRKPSGEWLDLAVTHIPMCVEGKVVGVFGISKDITVLKKSEEKIHYLAYHDSLTGLHNRAFFDECLKQEIYSMGKMIMV
ncbi:PAS domain S-box protein [Halalkalibacter alkalisediminis]|uniref:PAS domain S-box protein n=1 Tax=Halalkalibacter alkalisediminis TaxID=935616 RepID=A0ABV6NFK8_9BACI|nr:PAS domain S-box protein [Halalkalibacter alkalisediminis]